MTTLDLQRRLIARGYDPGPLDGISGRLTRAALSAFQRDRGLPATGLPDALTLKALLGREAAPPADALLPWMAEARRLLGVAEVAGPRHAPTILGWARRLALPYLADETPWCGLFVGACVAATLPTEPLPANPLAARGWGRFGVACPPRPGAVLVFWRGSRAGWTGHVGFHAGEDAAAFHVLGGNQGNRVSIARVSRARLLSARWPRTAPEPPPSRPTTSPPLPAAARTGAPVAVASPLSTDEE